MSVAPDVLFYMSVVLALIGVGQFTCGVWLLNKADNTKKFTASVLQGGGLGWMGAAAVFHFASGHDWTFIAGLAIAGAGSTIGALTGMRFLKARGETLQ